MARSLSCFLTRSGIGALLLASGILMATACGAEPPRAVVDDRPLRVVGLIPSLNDIIVEMGAGDALAARTDYDTHDRVDQLPTVGGGLDPSLEALVDLEIDVVLTAGGRATPELASRLEPLGIRVQTFPTQTVEDLYTSIERLGVLLDRRAAADSLSRTIRRDLDAVVDRVAGHPVVSVMYVVWSDPPQTAGGGTFIDEVITIAGGRNVFADAALEWPNVGFESIVERAPDVILWPQGEYSMDNLEALQGQPGWRDIGAVQEGRVVFLDPDLFNRPGPTVTEAARTLAAALHPEAH